LSETNWHPIISTHTSWSAQCANIFCFSIGHSGLSYSLRSDASNLEKMLRTPCWMTSGRLDSPYVDRASMIPDHHR
jgi:hypothetical protein